MNTPWSDDRIAELRRLLNEGKSQRLIGIAMGISASTVAGKIHRLGWSKVDPLGKMERAKLRERRKNRRKRDRLRREKLKAEAAKRAINLGYSKTSAEYRRKLPPAPEMTKSELSAMLAEAVRNTARMTA